MGEDVKPQFQNTELNKKYEIRDDHDIEIQQAPHKYKGRLSGIQKEDTLQYLIGRGHAFVSVKPETKQTKNPETPPAKA